MERPDTKEGYKNVEVSQKKPQSTNTETDIIGKMLQFHEILTSQATSLWLQQMFISQPWKTWCLKISQQSTEVKYESTLIFFVFKTILCSL